MLDLTIMQGEKNPHVASQRVSGLISPFWWTSPSACGWDGVSEPQGARLGPFRKTSPRGQSYLIKSVYSLLLQEIGWVCRLAEEERRPSSAVSCHSFVTSACWQSAAGLWFWVSAAGTCPLSWHRRGDSPLITLCPSSETTGPAWRRACWLALKI